MQNEIDDIFDNMFDDPKPIVNNKIDTNKEEIPDIELTDEFLNILYRIDKTNENVFLSGDAGTGKSTLINYFIRTTKKNIVVLAPTGVAAVNIGGQTIHSFFRFPPKPLSWNNVPDIGNDQNARLIHSKVDVIIIDEISMVRSDLLDGINMFYEKNFNSNLPFGGKQIIMVGDLMQLPPVVAKTAEKEMFADKYNSQYFFDSIAINSDKFKYSKVKLTKIFRQSDPKFIEFLNRIRNDSINLIDLNWINSQCYRNTASSDAETITLCSVNNLVDSINRIYLDKIQSREYRMIGQINGNFNPKNCRVPEELVLKIGAKVMILINDQMKRYHNGTIGIIEQIDEKANKILVKIKNGSVWIERHEWESFNYTYDRTHKHINHKSTGSFLQFPIVLGFATSIHKSQGMTFDKVNIDLGSGSFSHGQTYVALSRCRSIEGITLSKRLSLSDFIFDKKIKNYLNI